MKEKTLPRPSAEQIEQMDRYVKYLDSIDPTCDCEEINMVLDSMENLWSEYDFYDEKFIENGLAGLKDVRGNVRMPAIYTDILDQYEYGSGIYSYPVPVANADKKIGLADQSGNIILDFTYDEVCLIDCHYFLTRKDGKFGMTDRYGNFVLPCEYDSICEPCGNVYVTENDGKFGFYTCKGEGLVIPCIYDEIDERCDAVYVCYKGTWGYVSTEGNFIAEQDYNDNDILSFDTCPY